MSINKRVRVSYRYVRRGQTSLWDCVGKDTEETVPDDLGERHRVCRGAR